MKQLATVLALLLLFACSGAPVREAPTSATQPLSASLARAPGWVESPLNVSITVFSDSNAVNGRSVPVREAERRYLPMELRQALNESGFWGAVRVVPAPDPGAELAVYGEIVASDGVELVLDITAVDATGLTWLKRRYADSATDHAYNDESSALREPFDDLFNAIANDLSTLLSAQPPENRQTVLKAATLKYAAALSPEAFAGFLREDEDGVLQVAALPARNDSMYSRANRIRESENRFVDLIDEQYEQIYQRMQTPYAYWRRFGYELIQYNRRIAATGGDASARGYEAMKDIYQTYQDSRMNQDELRELTRSFAAEVAPTVTQVAGRVVQLTGSLENQYDEWRSLMRQFYDVERGNGASP